MYKGQGQIRSGLCDPPLQGIPSLWGIIAIPSPKHAVIALSMKTDAVGISKVYPLLSE